MSFGETASQLMQDLKYISLDETMRVEFQTDELDIRQLGVLNHHLHEVLNQVAISMFQVHDEIETSGGRKQMLPFIPQSYDREDTLISARIRSLKRESPLTMELAPYVAAIFSQPGASAILQNLCSNAIWAIGVYGTRVPGALIKHVQETRLADIFVRPRAGRRLLRPKVQKFIKQLAESSNGGRLKFRSKDEELEIEFYRNASNEDESTGA